MDPSNQCHLLCIGKELWASSFGVRTTKFILLLSDANEGAARGLLGMGRWLQGERLWDRCMAGCLEMGRACLQCQRVSSFTGSQGEQEPRKLHSGIHPPTSKWIRVSIKASSRGARRRWCASDSYLLEGGEEICSYPLSYSTWHCTFCLYPTSAASYLRAPLRVVVENMGSEVDYAGSSPGYHLFARFLSEPSFSAEKWS